jgi:ribonucleoside-diphosphate reductase beta chain
MGLLDKRLYYKPFEYQWAYDYYRTQQSVHWTKDEFKLAEDLQNWSKDLTEREKTVIGGILKGFVQAEVLVGDYWRKVAEWFPKPEIQMMASTFSYFESIHIDNYALLNEELGLTNFEAFIQDEKTKAKLDYLIDVKGSNLWAKLLLDIPDFIPFSKEIKSWAKSKYNKSVELKDIATSLAIFSAFTEGVLIFSSFAVLLSFQKENLLKAISQIVSLSIRDENHHSNGGIELFKTLCNENSQLKEEVELDIIKAAEIVFQLESDFIDSIFKGENIRTLTPNDLKEFIKYRINMKLRQLGYSDLYDVDNNAIQRMSWFDSLSSGREFGDFFAVRVTEYTKVEFNQNDLF